MAPNIDLEKSIAPVDEKPDIPTQTFNEKYQEWMSNLPGETPVSYLTIPGTHDSGAYTQPWPYVATQTMTILEQLDAGIRYFDLRCGLIENVTEMVHGPRLLNLRLSDVVGTMYDWLDKHPTEGLIVQIKEDRKSEGSTIHFSQAIFQNIATRADKWRTANTTPTLAELRGKIQLFRRYRGPSLYAYGIDVTQWEDNPSLPFTIFTRHGVQLTIQDHYNFSEPQALPSLIARKGGDVSRLLERADADTNEKHWFINFSSAYEFNFWHQLTPRAIAVGGYYVFRWEDGMNVRLRNWLKLHDGKRRFGIVAMDFPNIGTEDLVDLLIASNLESSQIESSKKLRVVLSCTAAMVVVVMIYGWLLPELLPFSGLLASCWWFREVGEWP